MKKLLISSAFLLSAFATAQSTDTAPAAAPVAPKQINIVVGDFQCASYSCSGGVLADALTNALMQSGRYAVYERAALGQGVKEGFMQGSDIGTQVQGADVLVVGTITAYGQDSGGGNACFMGVCMGAKTQKIAANLRIFDVKTSRIIGTAQVQGTSTGSAGSLNLAGLHLGGNQSGDMDKAMAVMLNDAVQKLTATIPTSYYR